MSAEKKSPFGGLLGFVVLFLAGFFVFQSCGSNETDPTRQTVRAEEYGENWPFTVDVAEVQCRPGSVAIVHVEGKIYALNGNALMRGYTDLSDSEVWRDNPAIPGAKISISPLIRLALSLGD